MYSKKEVRRINDREDYEKSGFKGVMDDVDKNKEEALDSVPEIPKEQVPKKGETAKELLFGDRENDAGKNNHDTILEENVNSEDKNEIISAKMSKFGKGFKIPDDKTDS